MTEHAVVCINYGNVLCENSRLSMQHAASRWQANYREFNEHTIQKLAVHPAAMKCAVFQSLAEDEIFILDADTIISSQCPNPFEAFGNHVFVAVQNGSARFGDYAQIKSCERYEWQKLIGSLDGYDENRYFNSGMILARRKYHEEMFRLALDLCMTDRGLGWIDQTPLNYAAVKLGIQLHLTTEQWHFIHPSMLGNGWMTMAGKAWIYHFAGEPGREKLLPRIQWR